MIGGFTFDGVDIGSENYNIEYIPEKRDVYPFGHATYNVHDKSFDGHDGGYFFGTTVQPKQISLKCFFEEIDLHSGIISKVEKLFKRGKTARLIFKDRDWIYYNATVISLDLSDVINMKSQIFIVTMKIYYPFGRSTIRYLTGNEPASVIANIKNNSSIMQGNNWNKTIFAYNGSLPTESTPITITGSGHKTYYLFNPGTEDAHALIYMKGYSEKGIKLQQVSKENCCRFNTFGSTNNSVEIKCDSLNGKTIVKEQNDAEWKNGYLYHDSGFIVVPPMYNEVIECNNATLAEGLNVINVNEEFDSEDVVGKVILIKDASDFCNNGYIAKINSVGSGIGIIKYTPTASAATMYQVPFISCDDIVSITAPGMTFTKKNSLRELSNTGDYWYRNIEGYDPIIIIKSHFDGETELTIKYENSNITGLQIDSTIVAEGAGTKDIVIIPMEKIEVSTNGGTTSLEKFDIQYMPTFS